MAALRGAAAGSGFVGPWVEVAALSVVVAIASWVLVERPVIEAAGRWRPWTRRVPTFPAERHIKPAAERGVRRATTVSGS